jgi:hypothetical protein
MNHELGPQYSEDDKFKAAARRHQSQYRAASLGVGFEEYGNRLKDADAESLLNYYDGLNVRQVLRERYPSYSKKRDADMLRSEHIPFNMFAPLKANPQLAAQVLGRAFDIELVPPLDIRFEWAPEDREKYLGDATAFDVYIQGKDKSGRTVGIGVEVKYTEHGYRMGDTEGERVNDKKSSYWSVTRSSGQFVDSESAALAKDDLRQIWRNHLLGLAMCQRSDIADFVSVILYPSGNDHFNGAIPQYCQLLKPELRSAVRGCTFEKFIDAISGDQEIMKWKAYLSDRYLVK